MHIRFSVKVDYSYLLRCSQVLELQGGIQRHCENHYKSQDLVNLSQLKTKVLQDLTQLLTDNGIPTMSEFFNLF